jgi:hypothetical protein
MRQLSSDLLARVKLQQNDCRRAPYGIGTYHRHQAELCLEIARQMIDRQKADRLCAAAAQHLAQAIERRGER